MDTIYVQMALGTFSTVIGGIVSWIGWKIQKAEKRREEAELRRKQEHENYERRLHQDIDLLKEGTLSILRDRLISTITECEKEGGARVYQIENVNHMFDSYTGLGGNGTVAHMFGKFKELPIIRGGDNDDDED